MVVLLQHNTCKQHRAAGDAHLLNTPLEDWILTAFMMLGGFFFLLILTGVNGESSSKVCRYHDVLNYLNLTQNNELFSMTRPVKNYKHPTKVILEVLLYAILDVKEIDQTFVPYVWIFVIWQNEYIYWDPDDFCGIRNISLPTEVLWKPDLTIEEMTEKDKAPPSPLLTINNNGTVVVQNDQVLVSSCRMHVYKFPFDTQSCTLSFKSVIHSVEDIQLHNKFSSSQATKWSREVMRTQYEWLFINMTVTSTATNMFGIKQDVIIYTITMKRRSILYIASFLLPILFFLCLDLASFLISDSGGEKLSFKVTVLLAVTVMQLILNAILPSSSDRIPLVAIYCIGIFSLMMLSLMETILVMYLTERDSASQDKEAGGDQSLSEGGEKKRTQYSSICDMPAEELPTDLSLSQGSGSHLTEESQGFGRFTEELREVVKILTLIYNSRKEEGKPGYWAGTTKKINKIFFIFYVIAASLFLFCMFFHWTHAPEL